MPGRVEEWRSVADELPPLDRAYQIDFRLLADRLAEIPDDVNRILRLLDGRRTLAQVLEEADHDALTAARTLARLWSEEIIRPAPSAPAPRGAAREPPSAVDGSAPPARPGTPEPAEWFSGPVDAGVAPEPSASRGASEALPADSPHRGDPPPRIVRFPRRTGSAVFPEGEVTTTRLLHLMAKAEAGRQMMALERDSARRAAAAAATRRRSLAALLLAGCLLAAFALWKVFASRGGAGNDATATSTSNPPSTEPRPAAPGGSQ
jgi:hypothetical protein